MRHSRRQFISNASLALGATLLPSTILDAQNQVRAKYRAAIIGHTGRGNYGHHLDVVFNHREDVEVVAISDPDPTGRSKAAERSRALRQYADYREMLNREKPRLVSIAPRWTDQHHAMAMASLESGAHIYIEKPITTTLAEADELLALAEQRNLKIAVAHQMRLAPNILHLKKSIDAGLIGDLLQIRGYGKQDKRAGGEDLIVLGTHVFDLMRFYAGDARWCSARVLQDGHDISRADARRATEDVGPIAGDEVEAQFAFANGVQGTFTSRARLRDFAGHWGLELIGSKGAARILLDIVPRIHLLQFSQWTDSGKTEDWRPWQDDPSFDSPADQRGFNPANQRVVDDWIEAIEQDREPTCSGHAGMKALEMVMAIYQSALSAQRVSLPLADRKHPLL